MLDVLRTVMVMLRCCVFSFLVLDLSCGQRGEGCQTTWALQVALRHDAWEPTLVWPSGKTPQWRKYLVLLGNIPLITSHIKHIVKLLARTILGTPKRNE